MKKSNKSNNTLIKRNNLKSLLKSLGINRISKDALELIEKKVEQDLEKFGRELKEEMIVNGRRGVDEGIVKGVFESKKGDDEEDVL